MIYAFDSTGNSPGNLVVNELRTLTEVNDAAYRIVIPDNAPFYTTNLVVAYDSGVNTVTLQEGVDYVLVLPYLAASRSVGVMVYGGISFNFNAPNGTVKVTYQTLGGQWIADIDYVYQVLAQTAYNERVTTWDALTNVQEIFPPINHDQSLDYVFGYRELIESISSIADTIASTDTNNPTVLVHQLELLVNALEQRLATAEQEIQDLKSRVQALE